MPEPSCRRLAIPEIANLLEKEARAATGKQRFVYLGSCMNPLLKKSDELCVKEISPKKLVLGDIIVYQDSGVMGVHRFLYSGPAGVALKADAYFGKNKTLSASCLVGKVEEIRRGSRKINLSALRWRIAAKIFWACAVAELFACAALRRKAHSPVIKTGEKIALSAKIKLFAALAGE